MFKFVILTTALKRQPDVSLVLKRSYILLHIAMHCCTQTDSTRFEGNATLSLKKGTTLLEELSGFITY